jgi:hypothetical protein
MGRPEQVDNRCQNAHANTTLGEVIVVANVIAGWVYVMVSQRGSVVVTR